MIAVFPNKLTKLARYQSRGLEERASYNVLVDGTSFLNNRSPPCIVSLFEPRQTYWVNIPERDGWLLVNIDGRKLGIIITTTEGGNHFLTVAGYHAGESRFIGERQNILSIRVEPIPKEIHNSFLVLVQKAVPEELKDLPITFL